MVSVFVLILFSLEHHIYKDFAAKAESDLNNEKFNISYLFTGFSV